MGSPDRKRVLFLCTGNSCRSQMAEGFLRATAPTQFEVESAGARPSRVNPTAVEVMAEIGIDISNHSSKSVELFAGQTFDYVITVCHSSKEAECPIHTGPSDKQLHWPFEDPAGAVGDKDTILEVFRQVRDQIRDKVECFARRETGAEKTD